MRLAVNPAWLVASGSTPGKSNPALKDRIGLWLLGGVERDVASAVWTVNAPPREQDLGPFRSWFGLAPDVPVVFDAVFPDLDSEYVAAAMLERSSPVGP